MSTSSVRVTVRGPLWDGEADEAVTQWLERSRRDLANQALAIVRSKARRMNRSGRGGTGIAAAHTRIRGSVSDVVIVEGLSDKGQVWWPWLEGTSHRNATTRFKGYHVFRLARGIVAKRARKIAQDRLDEYIGRMGGR